jgi:predicted MFS family arabinose efflux permease
VARAILLVASPTALSVYGAQLLIGGPGQFLMPAVAAITLGIVGAKRFDRQFGKNQSFNSAGIMFIALLVAYVSYKLGYRAVAAVLAIPAVLSVLCINATEIDYRKLEAQGDRRKEVKAERLSHLVEDRVLF